MWKVKTHERRCDARVRDFLIITLFLSPQCARPANGGEITEHINSREDTGRQK